MSSALNEHTVKQIALGYLKSYYRYRPRAEDSVGITSLDMRMEGGLIADGFLRFIQDDNLPFTATLEATSWKTRDEIFYRPRPTHVIWDATAFAFLLIPFSMAVLHLWKIYPLIYVGFWTGLAYLFGTALLWMGIYFVLFRRLPRYRYIYAIEQFKQYKADDQWVAYSYDVFGIKDKRRHRELVRQCTRYGFGLLEINARRQAKLILAPSRAEQFVPKRSVTKFLPVKEWQGRMEAMVQGPWKRITQGVRERLRPWQSQYFRWFPRTYPYQWTLALLGSIATIFFLRIEYQQRPVVYANEWLRQAELAQIPKRQQGEPHRVPQYDAPMPGLYDSTSSDYSLWEREEQFEGLVQGWGSNPQQELRPVRMVSVIPGQEAALYYDCARIRAVRSQFYVLFDTILPDLASARQRLVNWNDEGFAATAVWPACLGGPTEGFLIYVDEMLPDTMTARILRDSFQLLRDSTAKPFIIREFLPRPEVSEEEPVSDLDY